MRYTPEQVEEIVCEARGVARWLEIFDSLRAAGFSPQGAFEAAEEEAQRQNLMPHAREPFSWEQGG